MGVTGLQGCMHGDSNHYRVKAGANKRVPSTDVGALT